MTRKHFNAIAAALADCRPRSPEGQLSFQQEAAYRQWEQTVSEVTHAIDTVCPNFNRVRFYRAATGAEE